MSKSNEEIFMIATPILAQVDQAITNDAETEDVTAIQMLEMIDVLLCAAARIVVQFDEHIREYGSPRRKLHERLDHWLDNTSNNPPDDTVIN